MRPGIAWLQLRVDHRGRRESSTPSHGAVQVSCSTGKNILASVAESHKRKWQGGGEVIPRSRPNSARNIRVDIGVNKDRELSWRIPWASMVIIRYYLDGRFYGILLRR